MNDQSQISKIFTPLTAEQTSNFICLNRAQVVGRTIEYRLRNFWQILTAVKTIFVCFKFGKKSCVFSKTAQEPASDDSPLLHLKQHSIPISNLTFRSLYLSEIPSIEALILCTNYRPPLHPLHSNTYSKPTDTLNMIYRTLFPVTPTRLLPFLLLPDFIV